MYVHIWNIYRSRSFFVLLSSTSNYEYVHYRRLQSPPHDHNSCCLYTALALNSVHTSLQKFFEFVGTLCGDGLLTLQDGISDFRFTPRHPLHMKGRPARHTDYSRRFHPNLATLYMAFKHRNRWCSIESLVIIYVSIKMRKMPMRNVCIWYDIAWYALPSLMTSSRNIASIKPNAAYIRNKNHANIAMACWLPVNVCDCLGNCARSTKIAKRINICWVIMNTIPSKNPMAIDVWYCLKLYNIHVC